MATIDRFDAARSRLILKDLLGTLGGSASLLSLEPFPHPYRVVRGVADRSGLLRLGLRIALAALEAESTVSVRANGSISRDGDLGLIEIVIDDDPPGMATGWRGLPPMIGCLALTAMVAAVFALVAIAVLAAGLLFLDWLRG